MTIRQDAFNEMKPDRLYIGYNTTDETTVELWMTFGKSRILLSVFHEDGIPDVDHEDGSDLKDELLDYMRSGGLVPLKWDLTDWHFEFLDGTIDEFEQRKNDGTADMTQDDEYMIACPKCGAEQEDFDGFGVLHCEECGYCVHPSGEMDDDGCFTCGICGHVIEEETI